MGLCSNIFYKNPGYMDRAEIALADHDNQGEDLEAANKDQREIMGAAMAADAAIYLEATFKVITCTSGVFSIVGAGAMIGSISLNPMPLIPMFFTAMSFSLWLPARCGIKNVVNVAEAILKEVEPVKTQGLHNRTIQIFPESKV